MLCCDISRTLRIAELGKQYLDVRDSPPGSLTQALVTNPCVDAEEDDDLLLFLVLLDRKSTKEAHASAFVYVLCDVSQSRPKLRKREV